MKGHLVLLTALLMIVLTMFAIDETTTNLFAWLPTQKVCCFGTDLYPQAKTGSRRFSGVLWVRGEVISVAF